MLKKLRVQSAARSMHNQLGPDCEVVFEEHEAELQCGLAVVVSRIHGGRQPMVENRSA